MPNSSRKSYSGPLDPIDVAQISVKDFFTYIWTLMVKDRIPIPGRIDDEKDTDKLQKENLFLTMTLQDRSGQFVQHHLNFRDFVEENERFMLFAADARDEHLVSALKLRNLKPHLEWQFPVSNTRAQIQGPMYLVMTPSRYHPIIPPQLSTVGKQMEMPVLQNYWQDIRRMVWDGLSPRYRANWSADGNEDGLDLTPIPAMHIELDPEVLQKESAAQKQIRERHDAALENFALGIVRVEDLVVVDRSKWPETRSNAYQIQAEGEELKRTPSIRSSKKASIVSKPTL